MPVCCNRCGDEIISKNDLIVTSTFFKFYAYHKQCFDLEHKSSGMLIRKSQLNNFNAIIAPIMLLVLYLFSLANPYFRAEPVLHIFWIPLIVLSFHQRIYSFFKFERKLKI